jgi:copper(I)-binding protein
MGALLSAAGRAIFVIAAGAILFCGTGCSTGVPELSIEEQDGKLSPVILGSGSVFMKIVNNGRGDDALMSAELNIAGSLVELHESSEGKMIRTERIPIPAKTTVQLRPAGYHIMIFKMPKETQDGKDYVVTLTFEKSGKMSIPVQFTGSQPVRKR